jgi:hypothetical protein
MIMANVALHTNEMEVSRNIPRSPTLIKLETFSKILELKITMTSVIVIRKKHGTSYHWLT